MSNQIISNTEDNAWNFYVKRSIGQEITDQERKEERKRY